MRELVTGTWSVSVVRAVAGVNVTMMLQVEAGTSVVQVVVSAKFVVAVVDWRFGGWRSWCW